MLTAITQFTERSTTDALSYVIEKHYRAIRLLGWTVLVTVLTIGVLAAVTKQYCTGDSFLRLAEESDVRCQLARC